MPSKTDDKYTDPELRDEVKEEIQAGDKGGARGQWSARKAQMMASVYKKRGGGYTTDKKDEKANHFDQWTEEEWQTKDDDGKAKKDDGTEKRHLPKKAWEQTSEEEKAQTDAKKQKDSKEGQQHVANTSEAKDAQKDAQNHDEESSDDKKQKASKAKKSYEDAKDCTEHWDDPDHLDANQKEYAEFQKSTRKTGHAAVQDEGGSKRGRGANSASSPNKKQRTGGGAHDEPTVSAGDKTRVPKEGQKVQWKELPGYVDGEVMEVVYEEKKVDGKSVKASKEDPRIVLKSDSSGKICVHKPEAVYFD